MVLVSHYFVYVNTHLLRHYRHKERRRESFGHRTMQLLTVSLMLGAAISMTQLTPRGTGGIGGGRGQLVDVGGREVCGRCLGKGDGGEQGRADEISDGDHVGCRASDLDQTGDLLKKSCWKN